MMKNIDYYLSLPYKYEIEEIPEALGGGFSATIPLLGKLAFVGDGETVEEAYASLRALMRKLFAEYLEAGVAIPEPPAKDYSGKFLVRVPLLLHQTIAETAEENRVSMNTFVVSLLSGAMRGYEAESASSVCAAKVETLCKDMKKTLDGYWFVPPRDTGNADNYFDEKEFKKAV